MQNVVGVEYTIEFGGDPHDVTITISGTADVATFRQCHEQLIDDERFEPGMLILIDQTDLDLTPLSAEDIETIAIGVADRETGGQSVVAVVAPRPGSFGVNRMGMSRIEEKTTLTTQVFFSHEEALGWLREIKQSRGG